MRKLIVFMCIIISGMLYYQCKHDISEISLIIQSMFAFTTLFLMLCSHEAACVADKRVDRLKNDAAGFTRSVLVVVFVTVPLSIRSIMLALAEEKIILNIALFAVYWASMCQ